MTSLDIWLNILGLALIAFAVRYYPMALLERFRLPPQVQQGLRYVPAATLAGLVFPALLTHNSRWAGLAHPELWAGLLAALVAWRFKNALLTIGVGLLALWLLRSVGL